MNYSVVGVQQQNVIFDESKIDFNDELGHWYWLDQILRKNKYSENIVGVLEPYKHFIWEAALHDTIVDEDTGRLRSCPDICEQAYFNKEKNEIKFDCNYFGFIVILF